MINITMRELVDSIEVFKFFLDQPMRAKTAYKLSLIIDIIEKENNKFNDLRNHLIQNYAERDENNNLIEKDNCYNIIPDKIPEFNKELNELLDMELNLYVNPLDLEDIENFELTPRQLFKINKYIKKREAE